MQQDLNEKYCSMIRQAREMALGRRDFPDYTFPESIPEEGEVYRRAMLYAAMAHEGVCRKGKKVPFIVHPVEVATIVENILKWQRGSIGDEEYKIMAAAVLHDVIEDTSHTYEDIKQEFGEFIADTVAHESEDKRKDLPPANTWKLRKQEAIAHINHTPVYVRAIALGDKLSNLRDLIADYEAEGNAVWDVFNQHDPAEHSWYYSNMANAFKDFKGSGYYEEYMQIGAKVFGWETE